MILNKFLIVTRDYRTTELGEQTLKVWKEKKYKIKQQQQKTPSHWIVEFHSKEQHICSTVKV